MLLFFGFIKNDIGEPKDYEMRFYDNHDAALKFGKNMQKIFLEKMDVFPKSVHCGKRV